MNHWFVYQGEGSHVGPVTTDLLVRGLAAGRVPKDAHVAMAGSAEWKPVMTIGEVVKALDAFDGTLDGLDADAPPASLGLGPILPAIPPALESEADPTEVIRRDEMLKAGLALKAKAAASGSGAPPKPPTPPRTSTNPPAPLRPSGSMTAAVAPSKSNVPAAPAAGTPPPPPPPPAAAQNPSAPPPPPPGAAVAPPPPNTVRTLEPEKRFAPPPPPAVDPPKDEPKKDEPKKPVVDPKTALLLPLGVFGVFVFLSLIVVVISFVTRP